MVSNINQKDHMIIFRVLHGKGILNLVLCDLGVFQVLLDVLHLEKLQNLQVFYLCLRVVLSLVALVRFYSLEG